MARNLFLKYMDALLNYTVAVFVCLMTGVTLLFYTEGRLWDFIYYFREGFVPLVLLVYIHEKLNKSNYVKAGMVLYLSKCIYELLLLCGLFTLNESRHVFYGSVLVSIILLSLYLWDRFR